MATRIAPALVAIAAAAIVPFSFGMPGMWSIVPLALGIATCTMLYVSGYRLAFFTYAIACWCMAAISLTFERALDSPLSSSFADASYIVAAIGIFAALVRRRAV